MNRELELQDISPLPRLPPEIVQKISSGLDDQRKRELWLRDPNRQSTGWLPYMVDSSSELLTLFSPEVDIAKLLWDLKQSWVSAFHLKDSKFQGFDNRTHEYCMVDQHILSENPYCWQTLLILPGNRMGSFLRILSPILQSDGIKFMCIMKDMGRVETFLDSAYFRAILSFRAEKTIDIREFDIQLGICPISALATLLDLGFLRSITTLSLIVKGGSDSGASVNSLETLSNLTFLRSLRIRQCGDINHTEFHGHVNPPSLTSLRLSIPGPNSLVPLLSMFEHCSINDLLIYEETQRTLKRSPWPNNLAWVLDKTFPQLKCLELSRVSS